MTLYSNHIYANYYSHYSSHYRYYNYYYMQEISVQFRKSHVLMWSISIGDKLKKKIFIFLSYFIFINRNFQFFYNFLTILAKRKEKKDRSLINSIF